MEIEKIESTGYKDSVIENVFFNHDAHQLVIMFPGMGYTNDMPLQYYLGKYFETEQQMDVYKVNYRYNDNHDFIERTIEEKFEWIRTDIVAAVDHVLKRKKYERIVLVCKSIGTMAGIEAIKSVDALKEATVIWLTPLCQDETIMNELLQIDNPSLIVIGTEDSCYVKGNIEKLEAKSNYKVMTIPHAEHSLEIRGNVASSIKIMEKIVKQVAQFYRD